MGAKRCNPYWKSNWNDFIGRGNGSGNGMLPCRTMDARRSTAWSPWWCCTWRLGDALVSRTCFPSRCTNNDRIIRHRTRETMDVIMIRRTNQRTIKTVAGACPTRTLLLRRVVQRMIPHRDQGTLLRANIHTILHDKMVAATRHNDKHNTKSRHGTMPRTTSLTSTSLDPRTTVAVTMATTAADLRTRVVFRNGTASCILVPRRWRLPLGIDSALVRGRFSWCCA
jgi:hypothetical protein